MNNITKRELEERKEHIAKLLQERQNTPLILEGEMPSLIYSKRLLTNRITLQEYEEEYKRYPSMFFKRYTEECDKYLGAILLLLHEQVGCNVIYSEEELKPGITRRFSSANDIINIYQDENIINFIRSHHIETLLSLGINDSPYFKTSRKLTVLESTSSYNLGNSTNFSSMLSYISKRYGFDTELGFYITSKYLLLNSGFCFSDSVIQEYQGLNINICEKLNRDLIPSEIWPYTAEAMFTTNSTPDIEQMESIYNIIKTHLIDVNALIKEQGIEMSLKRRKM